MLTFVLVLIVSPILVIGKTDISGKDTRNAAEAYCTTNLGTYAHGTTFPSRSNPCLVFRCEFGYARIISEGCHEDNACHPVGATWLSRDCHTNTCIKLQEGENPVFRRKRLATGCQDVYKMCRKPGDVFSFEQHGTIHRHCYCQTTIDVIDYYCLD